MIGTDNTARRQVEEEQKKLDQTCITTCMDDYLAKPVELRDLARKLDQWLPIAESAGPVDLGVLAAITGGDAAGRLEFDLIPGGRGEGPLSFYLLEGHLGQGCEGDAVRHSGVGEDRIVGRLHQVQVPSLLNWVETPASSEARQVLNVDFKGWDPHRRR